MTSAPKMTTKINKIYSIYKGYWVSISEDYSEIFAHSKDLDKLVEEINKRKLKKGMIMKIPPQKYSAYVG